VEGRRLSVYFLYLAWRLQKRVVTLVVTGNTTSGKVFRCQRMSPSWKHRLSVDRKSMGLTVAERSCKDADYRCVFPSI
jgi:hypothetical protein